MSVVDDVLAAFPRFSALIVGDICADRWCTYDPALGEPSRETGIPRTAVTHTIVTPGAGGTIANNLRALGIGRVATLGVIGEDGFGWELRQALNAGGIDTDLLVPFGGYNTFTYTKLLNRRTGEEDLPRIDYVPDGPLPAAAEAQVIAQIRDHAESFDVLFIADQAETESGGVITEAVRSALSAFARAHPGKTVWADSRVRTALFRDIIVKPNQEEAAAACNTLFGTVDYARLREHVRAPLLFVTQGPRGVIAVSDSSEHSIPARTVEHPVDICGAGDSFSAGAAVALAATGSPVEAARFGNLVASITIQKKGTGTASPAEVRAAAATA